MNRLMVEWVLYRLKAIVLSDIIDSNRSEYYLVVQTNCTADTLILGLHTLMIILAYSFCRIRVYPDREPWGRADIVSHGKDGSPQPPLSCEAVTSPASEIARVDRGLQSRDVQNKFLHVVGPNVNCYNYHLVLSLNQSIHVAFYQTL